MSEIDRPTFYYLFPDGKDFKIIAMTDVEAAKLWERGRRWVDVPKRTREEAEELRLAYLSAKPR
jgi:hypothetical protein